MNRQNQAIIFSKTSKYRESPFFALVLTENELLRFGLSLKSILLKYLHLCFRLPYIRRDPSLRNKAIVK